VILTLNSRRSRLILCICFGVSDRAVRQRASEGVPLDAVIRETGAGSACGMCLQAIARVHAGEAAARPRCAVPCARAA
jgi:bacterioferritin-associated ferredoxin